jgi:hypothetical protein
MTNRYITAHSADGKAVLSTALKPEIPSREVLQGDIKFSLVYTNKRQPSFFNDQDIKSYEQYLGTPPAITIPEGTVCRICDFAPGYVSPMHRTVSLDFGVVLEGEMELVLDSGETQHLYRGDTVVQRGTNHAWRNVTPEKDADGRKLPQWARMLYVLQTADPVVLGSGERLEGDEGGIDRGVHE